MVLLFRTVYSLRIAVRRDRKVVSVRLTFFHTHNGILPEGKEDIDVPQVDAHDFKTFEQI